MLIRRKQHETPGLNTTSTADISFMLLIFFLVTTSMDVDKGLLRQLPSPEPQKKEQQQLRQEYIFAVKNNLRSTLNNIDIKEKDGSITRLQDLDPTRKA